MKWNYYNPVSIHGGIGVLENLPTIVGNRTALLVAFPEAAELGLSQQVEKLLGDRLQGVILDVRPNPDVSWLQDMYAEVWQRYAQVDCIIALGGGSSIDCAKALLSATSTRDFRPLLECLRSGSSVPFCGCKKLIAIPTTAGTGSEVTPWATVWDSGMDRKYSLHLPWTWAEHAIVDPSLMVSLPKSVTLASGLDAMSHALESIWNVNRNPISAGFACQAIGLVMATLPTLMNDLGNVALRKKMAEAALKAGLAFSNTKTALAHSISYEFTLHNGLPHGIACSFCLPRVMQLAFGRNAEVDNLLQDIFQVQTPVNAVERLTQFLESMGVATHPDAYGVSEDEWASLVNRSLEGARGKNFLPGTKLTH